MITLLAVVALGASWFMLRALNAESNKITAIKRERNAEALSRAKQALIGYIAAKAATSGEANPGAFPCPEAPADFNSAANEGIATPPSSCTPPVLGRFPWRTLGLDQLVDASGEPLWYSVAKGWSGDGTVINSNCATYDTASTFECQKYRLTVDGATSDVIAVIIAPGASFSTPSATGCAAVTQARSTAAPPSIQNYFECENATSTSNTSFVSTKPSIVDTVNKTVTPVLNDQLMTVTVSDVMPAIEAAIATRIEREIAPVLQSVYAAPTWGLSGSARKYPFAAAFSDPSTSSMQGASATLAGLMPMSNAETFPKSGVLCTPDASRPLCNPTFVSWASANMAGSGSTYNESCAVTSTAVTCTFSYRACSPVGDFLGLCSPQSTESFTVNATANNVGMAMRTLNSSTSGMTNVASVASLSAVLNPNGSATVALSGVANVASASQGGLLDALTDVGCLLSGVADIIFDCNNSGSVTIPITVLADHSLLDTRTSSATTTTWFTRNKWHELTYYAVASGYAPSGAASCTTGADCLTVTNATPTGGQRAILVLAGRAINGAARPSSTLADYFEFGNAGGGTYERHSVTAAPAITLVDTGVANAYSAAGLASVTSGMSFVFKAANANSGASTLSTPATGALALVNSDGSALAGSTIRANAAVHVTYDGSKFLLSRRPFNDRIVVVDSN